MKTGKRKSARRTPNLTVEAGALTVFTDSLRGEQVTGSSEGIVISYDPAVAALEDRLRRRVADARSVQNLTRILEDCLRTARTIKNKRGTELVHLLRDAKRHVKLMDER
jgi:hypothetical protein